MPIHVDQAGLGVDEECQPVGAGSDAQSYLRPGFLCPCLYQPVRASSDAKSYLWTGLSGVHHLDWVHCCVHERRQPTKSASPQRDEEHPDGSAEVHAVPTLQGPKSWSVWPSSRPLRVADGDRPIGLADAGKAVHKVNIVEL